MSRLWAEVDIGIRLHFEEPVNFQSASAESWEMADTSTQPESKRLMPGKRRPPKDNRKPELTVRQILEWADDYLRRHVRWPNHTTGRINRTNETWLSIDRALGRGNRESLLRNFMPARFAGQVRL